MRRVLLDTHTLLWWLRDDPRLGPDARTMIADERNDAFVSAVSSWEISIKKSLGKLEAPADLGAIIEDEGFVRWPSRSFMESVPVALAQLHRDPFDRMLVAQAQAEGLELITADARLAEYGVRTVNALR